MSKERTLLISVLCLSVSIIISAAIIANGMRSQGDSVNAGLAQIGAGIMNSSNNTSYDTGTLNITTASGYLQISEGDLVKLIGDTSSGIPYLKTGDNYTFSKDALDKWLETARVEVK